MRHGGGEYEILPVIWHESDHSLKFSSPTYVSSRVLHGNSRSVFRRADRKNSNFNYRSGKWKLFNFKCGMRAVGFLI